MKQSAKVWFCRNFITSDFHVRITEISIMMQNIEHRHSDIFVFMLHLLVQNKLLLLLCKNLNTEKRDLHLKSEREEKEQILCFQCNQDNYSSVSALVQTVHISYSYIHTTPIEEDPQSFVSFQCKTFTSFLSVFASDGSEACCFCRFTVCHVQQLRVQHVHNTNVH